MLGTKKIAQGKPQTGRVKLKISLADWKAKFCLGVGKSIGSGFTGSVIKRCPKPNGMAGMEVNETLHVSFCILQHYGLSVMNGCVIPAVTPENLR